MLFPKAETDSCCGGAVKTLVVACSGGSNVGQIANNVMIELDKREIGNAYCLAGIGAAPSVVERRHSKSTALRHHAILLLPSWALRKFMISANWIEKQKQP